MRHRRKHGIDRLLRVERRLVLAGRIEDVVAIESVGQFLCHEMAEQQAAGRLVHVFLDHRQAERFAAADARQDRFAPRVVRFGVRFDQFHLRQHFAVPRGLEKTHVRGVGVDDVHVLEVDALALKLATQLPGDDGIGGDCGGRAIQQKERVPQLRIEIRLHDQVRRLPVREPHAADRGDGGADHDGIAHGFGGRGRQHHDDHQRANREPYHRHAVENAGRKRDDGRDREDGGQEQAAIAAEQDESDAFQQSCLGDDRDEKRQAQDEEHRVGVNQIVEAAEREQMVADPGAPATLHDLGMPRGGRKPRERGDDDEQHAVGQGILVDLKAEGAEQEQAEDCQEHFGAEEPERQRRQAADDEQQEGCCGASAEEIRRAAA